MLSPLPKAAIEFPDDVVRKSSDNVVKARPSSERSKGDHLQVVMVREKLVPPPTSRHRIKEEVPVKSVWERLFGCLSESPEIEVEVAEEDTGRYSSIRSCHSEEVPMRLGSFQSEQGQPKSLLSGDVVHEAVDSLVVLTETRWEAFPANPEPFLLVDSGDPNSSTPRKVTAVWHPKECQRCDEKLEEVLVAVDGRLKAGQLAQHVECDWESVQWSFIEHSDQRGASFWNNTYHFSSDFDGSSSKSRQYNFADLGYTDEVIYRELALHSVASREAIQKGSSTLEHLLTDSFNALCSDLPIRGDLLAAFLGAFFPDDEPDSNFSGVKVLQLWPGLLDFGMQFFETSEIAITRLMRTTSRYHVSFRKRDDGCVRMTVSIDGRIAQGVSFQLRYELTFGQAPLVSLGFCAYAHFPVGDTPLL